MEGKGPEEKDMDSHRVGPDRHRDGDCLAGGRGAVSGDDSPVIHRVGENVDHEDVVRSREVRKFRNGEGNVGNIFFGGDGDGMESGNLFEISENGGFKETLLLGSDRPDEDSDPVDRSKPDGRLDPVLQDDLGPGASGEDLQKEEHKAQDNKRRPFHECPVVDGGEGAGRTKFWGETRTIICPVDRSLDGMRERKILSESFLVKTKT